jgi:hypothetical protein
MNASVETKLRNAVNLAGIRSFNSHHPATLAVSRIVSAGSGGGVMNNILTRDDIDEWLERP